LLVTSAAPGLIPVEDVNGPMASHMIELIQQFGDLNTTIDRLATKPLTVQTDFPCDDFPKETAERLEILSKCDQYMHAVSVKDHMLWTVIKEKERQEELLQGERKLSHEYALEVTEWAEMSQNLTHSLNLLKLENEKLERKNKDLINVLRDNNLFYVDSGND
jgi:GTP-sensing pleiotropic transcriptional regulator CodY